MNWFLVRLLLALSRTKNLYSHSIEFVLAFPQANLDCEMSMEWSLGMCSESNGNCVLKLKSNPHGIKQGDYNWSNKVRKVLIDRGFTPLELEKCVCMSKTVLVLVHVDDYIVFSRSDSSINFLIKYLFEGTEKFELTNEGSIENRLGVKF